MVIITKRDHDNDDHRDGYRSTKITTIHSITTT